MRANDDLGCPHRPSALGNPVDSVRSDIALVRQDARVVAADRVNDLWHVVVEERGSLCEVRCAFLILANGAQGTPAKIA